jgi:predicted nucleic acid-binding protein
MRIYLDNCCYNRPFDDQTHARIVLETQAKMTIQELIKAGTVELAYSYMSVMENSDNPNVGNRESIASFFAYATLYIGSQYDDDIRTKVATYAKYGIYSKDATHLACAIHAQCAYLITTDDRFIKRYKMNEIIVCNPITFLQKGV